MWCHASVMASATTQFLTRAPLLRLTTAAGGHRGERTQKTAPVIRRPNLRRPRCACQYASGRRRRGTPPPLDHHGDLPNQHVADYLTRGLDDPRPLPNSERRPVDGPPRESVAHPVDGHDLERPLPALSPDRRDAWNAELAQRLPSGVRPDESSTGDDRGTATESEVTAAPRDSNNSLQHPARIVLGTLPPDDAAPVHAAPVMPGSAGEGDAGPARMPGDDDDGSSSSDYFSFESDSDDSDVEYHSARQSLGTRRDRRRRVPSPPRRPPSGKWRTTTR